MPDSSKTSRRSPWERLQDKVERLTDRTSDIVDLAQALTQEPGQIDEQACVTCQESLPEYIEAELNGRPARRLFPQVARHIDVCPACGEAYVDLVEIALQTETAFLPVPTRAPALDLSFLPSSSPAVKMRQLVERLVKELVRRLNPEALEDLSALEPEFFRRVGELETNLRLQPASTLALDFGTDLSPALCSLVSVYDATDVILHTMSTKELADELGGPRYPRTVERQARSSVQAMGMGPKESREWAEQYVILAQAHATEFLTLARQIAENEYSD
jgi:hypothetical protein